VYVSSHPPGPPHVRALDGVRAIAAIAVLLTHVGFLTGAVVPSMSGALTARLDIGVALFFTLSGFLMLRPWIATAIGDREHGPALLDYARKRTARILPAYWAAMTAVLLLEAGRVFSEDLSSSLRVGPTSVLRHVFVVQGLFGSYFSTFSQTWSLTTELTFYLVVPLIGVGLVRVCRTAPSRTARLLVVQRVCAGFVVIGAVAATYCASDLPGSSPTLGTSLLGHAAWFAAGAWVCTRTMSEGPSSTSRSADERLGLAAVLLVLAASPLGGGLLFDRGAPVHAGLRELLYAAVGALIVSAACRRRDVDGSAALRVLSSGALVWIGERSYAVFLWHLPIAFGLMTLLKLDLFEGSFLVVAGLTLGCSLIVADISWRLLERPVLATVNRRSESRRQQADQKQSTGLRNDSH